MEVVNSLQPLTTSTTGEPVAQTLEKKTSSTGASTSPSTPLKPETTSGLYQLDPAESRSGGLIDTLVRLYTQPPAHQQTLDANIKDGKVEVTTDDGYKISFEGKQMDWTITHPDGQKTYVWGDPHVNESDGTKWNFKEHSTFVFGNNKIVVQTTPWNNGETVTKSITLYNGDSRFSITDLDKNAPRITDYKLDGQTHDAQFSDGISYQLKTESKKKFSWLKLK